jgi:alpha/beta hydrolase fold
VAKSISLTREYPFSAALDDALACYRALLERGYAPARISVAGDSAGNSSGRVLEGNDRCGGEYSKRDHRVRAERDHATWQKNWKLSDCQAKQSR